MNNKVYGLVRRLDDISRVIIPHEFRRAAGLRPGDPVIISMQDGKIVLEKFNPADLIEE